jgi:hypothetical protein
MANRSERLAKFITDRDPARGVAVELLCEDHRGTYVIPFACVRAKDGWQNARTGEPIEPTVLGWREPKGIENALGRTVRTRRPNPDPRQPT